MPSKSNPQSPESLSCRACGSGGLQEVPGYSALPRVTSDCVPFRDGGRLFVCAACGAGQAKPDGQWFREIEDIYSKYNIYHQAGGAEQHILDSSTDSMRPRSEVLRERLGASAEVPDAGRLLDVGCGNGVTLRSFSRTGAWELHGLDIHDRNLSRLTTISGFRQLHTCEPVEVPGTFDLITLVHALEHFPDPVEFLAQLRPKLAANGALFVQVPDASANPFDHIVADHLLHFNPYALAALLKRAGFSRIRLFTDWVKKEISLIACDEGRDLAPEGSHAATPRVAQVQDQIVWLGRVIKSAREAASNTASYGLFGSSIAATWLFPKVADWAAFFVDEDPNRAGRRHLERPILTPVQVPTGSTVFIPLAPLLTGAIERRLANFPFQLRTPPHLTLRNPG